MVDATLTNLGTNIGYVVGLLFHYDIFQNLLSVDFSGLQNRTLFPLLNNIILLLNSQQFQFGQKCFLLPDI